MIWAGAISAVNGSPTNQTPNIDSLATDGGRFERLFVSAESAPTSAALLTGLHPLLMGVYSDRDGAQILNSNAQTLAEKLKVVGYKSGYFGRWRHGVNCPHRAKDQGFDRAVDSDAGDDLTKDAL